MLATNDDMWILASDIPETTTNWLWWPYVACENINIIAGMGNEGKGLVCTDLAARVTRGRAFPLCAEKHPPSNVVWCEMEDDLGSTIKPRLKAAGADLSRVTILQPNIFMKKSAQQRKDYIGEIIEAKRPRLLILSPMNSFLGPINLNSEMEVRAVFEEFRGFTLGTGCAILGIAHANKKAELTSIERISGSVAYVNFCRSVIFVTSESGASPETRRFIHGKFNLSKKAPDLLYTSRYAGDDKRQRDQYVRLDWDAPLSDVDHKKAFTAANESSDGDVKETAGDWLLRVLQENGPLSIASLKDRAAKAKHKWGTIDQARVRLNNKYTEVYIDSTDGNWALAKRNIDS